jgi:hypothetical protein
MDLPRDLWQLRRQSMTGTRNWAKPAADPRETKTMAERAWRSISDTVCFRRRLAAGQEA